MDLNAYCKAEPLILAVIATHLWACGCRRARQTVEIVLDNTRHYDSTARPNNELTKITYWSASSICPCRTRYLVYPQHVARRATKTVLHQWVHTGSSGGERVAGRKSGRLSPEIKKQAVKLKRDFLRSLRWLASLIYDCARRKKFTGQLVVLPYYGRAPRCTRKGGSSDVDDDLPLILAHFLKSSYVVTKQAETRPDGKNGKQKKQAKVCSGGRHHPDG